ncbi:MAG: hypothetical protein LBJ89_02025 [Holosporales bacterium]|nr:hypothetical protein [Holosporales bacterium]
MDAQEPVSGASFDVSFMRVVLGLAQKAFSAGAVPVGAVITRGKSIVAQSHNSFESANIPDSIRHAEIGAIELVRIRKVVFGAYNSSFVSSHSAAVSRPCLFSGEIIGGVMESDCSDIISQFFQRKR